MPLCSKWTRLAPDYDIVLAYSFAGQNATQVAERIVRITRNPFTNTLTRNCTLSEFSLARLCKSSESLHCPHLKRCKISLWKTERSRLKHYFNQSLSSWANIISWVNFRKFFRSEIGERILSRLLNLMILEEDTNRNKKTLARFIH